MAVGMNMRKVIIAILLVALLAGMAAGAAAQAAPAQVTNNVLQTAAAEKDLKMFSGAIDTAGLRDTLTGPGPYTIFAPTDNAFMKIPAPQMDAMTKDNAKMAALVKNHVVQGRYTIKDLANMGYVTTMDGQQLKVSSSGTAFAVDGAHIIRNDIPAGNGIIHVIDTIMVPK